MEVHGRETGPVNESGFGMPQSGMSGSNIPASNLSENYVAGNYAAANDVADTDQFDENEQEDMATSEERLFILRMLEQGKIKADEAARLLGALDNGQQTSSSTTQSRDPFNTAHGLRIRVQDIHSGKDEVNVNIPAGLVRFGLRFVPSSANIDVEAIQAAIESGSVGKIVEVVDQDGGKRVQIYLE
jgi:hypothetical protein